jgi:hypothetical protein
MTIILIFLFTECTNIYQKVDASQPGMVWWRGWVIALSLVDPSARGVSGRVRGVSGRVRGVSGRVRGVSGRGAGRVDADTNDGVEGEGGGAAVAGYEPAPCPRTASA